MSRQFSENLLSFVESNLPEYGPGLVGNLTNLIKEFALEIPLGYRAAEMISTLPRNICIGGYAGMNNTGNLFI